MSYSRSKKDGVPRRRESDSSSDVKLSTHPSARKKKSKSKENMSGNEDSSDSDQVFSRTVTLKLPKKNRQDAHKRSKVSEATTQKYDISDSEETLTSLDEEDFAQLGAYEDDSDIERFEGQALILDAEVEDVEESQPFAYAPDEESDHNSNIEESWMKELDVLDTGSVMEPVPLREMNPVHEYSEEAQLEAEFFMRHLSSAEDDDDDDEGNELDNFSFDEVDLMSMPDDDAGDTVEWDYLITDGGADSDDTSSDKEDDDSSTTDVEPPAVIIARHKAATQTPITPAKPTAKSDLTSCLKQNAVITNGAGPRRIESTPIKLNTSHNPPILGTWQRDNRGTAGIIDGMTTHSPVGPILPKKKLRSVRSNAEQSESDNAAMTSLDDIMFTNDLVDPDLEATPTKYDRPIHVGAFRRSQMKSALMREDSLQDEVFNIAARNSERSGRPKATPLLASTMSRKDKRRRKKMKAAATKRQSETLTDEAFNFMDTNDAWHGITQAPELEFGAPVESMFMFHQFV